MYFQPIERKFRQFAPLVVPKNLQKALPFKDKIIHKSKKQRDPESERVAVIREPHEREVNNCFVNYTIILEILI